jgi:hypothetical protein
MTSMWLNIALAINIQVIVLLMIVILCKDWRR